MPSEAAQRLDNSNNASRKPTAAIMAASNPGLSPVVAASPSFPSIMLTASTPEIGALSPSTGSISPETTKSPSASSSEASSVTATAAATALNPRAQELSKSLKRPPSLTELTKAMRLNPERWQQLKLETDQARAAEAVNVTVGPAVAAIVANGEANAVPATDSGGGPRLRLQISSLQRGASSRGSSPITGPASGSTHPPSTAGTPLGSGVRDLPDECAVATSASGPGKKEVVAHGRGRLPTLAAIQERMARQKSSDNLGVSSAAGPGEGKKLDDVASDQTKEAKEMDTEGAEGKGAEAPGQDVNKDTMLDQEAPNPASMDSKNEPEQSKAFIPPIVASAPPDASGSVPISCPSVESSTPTKSTHRPLHPLQHSWTLYFDSKATAASARKINSNSQPSSTDAASGDASVPPTPTGPTTPTVLGAGGQAYQAALQTIGTFETVEDFCRYFNWTKKPSRMEMHSSVQLFKSGIKPMWEDPANENGGKWTLTMRAPNVVLLDKLWTYLVLALVGEEVDLNDDVCGAVVATRPRGNRIQVWVRDKSLVERVNGLGKRLVELLEISENSGVAVDFTPHSGPSNVGASKFISISGNAPHSARPGLPRLLSNSAVPSGLGSNPPLRHNPPSNMPGLAGGGPSAYNFPSHVAVPSDDMNAQLRVSSMGVDTLQYRRSSAESAQLPASMPSCRPPDVSSSMQRPPLLVHHSHHMGMQVPPGMQAIIVPGLPPPGAPSGAGWRPVGPGTQPLHPGFQRSNSFTPQGSSGPGQGIGLGTGVGMSMGPPRAVSGMERSPQGKKAGLPPSPPKASIGLGIETTGA